MTTNRLADEFEIAHQRGTAEDGLSLLDRRALNRMDKEEQKKYLDKLERDQLDRLAKKEGIYSDADTTTVGQDIGNFFKVLFAFFSGMWKRDFYEFDLLSSVYFPAQGTPEANSYANMQQVREDFRKDPNKKITFEDIGPRNVLLSLIRRAEGDYNIAQGGRKVNFTDMTVGEVMQWQKNNAGKGETQAIGAYQFMPKTLAGLVKNYNIDLNAKFDKGMQDKLANHLMDERGYKEFITGQMPMTTFWKNVSKEWAGLPKDMSGLSYYQGVGSNKATVSAQSVKTALEQIKLASSDITGQPETKIAQKPVYPAGDIPSAPLRPAGNIPGQV